jgi:hypothetical protein
MRSVLIKAFEDHKNADLYLFVFFNKPDSDMKRLLQEDAMLYVPALVYGDITSTYSIAVAQRNR